MCKEDSIIVVVHNGDFRWVTELSLFLVLIGAIIKESDKVKAT
ncbi:hypothetical protein [Winogradskyella costae]|nr:hypothetical protein [Winogradskyella costae]